MQGKFTTIKFLVKFTQESPRNPRVSQGAQGAKDRERIFVLIVSFFSGFWYFESTNLARKVN